MNEMLTYEEIVVGKFYKYKSHIKFPPYFKAMVVDKSYIDMDHSGVEVPIITFEYLDETGMLTINSQPASSLIAYREPYCWKCKKDLFESTMSKCNNCGWIICPDDKSCKCNKTA
ncbi:hypothetical protein JNUCC23_09520 [Peribacillus sp. JNUCC 23]